MANKETENCEKFKTMIGGQALIEGIMMRGPEKDAIVIRGKDGLTVEVSPRKLNPPGSWKNWPFIRGIFNFFDAQIVGVKALLRSADLAPDEMQEERPNLTSGWKRSWEAKPFRRPSSALPWPWDCCFPSACFSCCPWSSADFLTKSLPVRCF